MNFDVKSISDNYIHITRQQFIIVKKAIPPECWTTLLIYRHKPLLTTSLINIIYRALS